MHRILNRLLLEYKYIKMKQLVLFLFFSSQCLINIAQTITGKITDENHNPLSFANVVLINAKDSAFVTGTTSNENGTFALKASATNEYLLRVSSIGYKNIIMTCKAGDIGAIVLSPEEQVLKGAVVTAMRPTFKLKDGALVTNVQNSLLSKSGTANDVIIKLPGIRKEGDSFNVFGKGTPIVYINGRKIEDLTELDRLSSSDIAQVELITNPGAQYDASVKAVLKIKTVKKVGDGLGGSVRSVIRQGDKTSFTEQANLNYRKNNLDVFGSFTFDFSQLYQKQLDRTTTLTKDTVWNINSSLTIHPRWSYYYSNVGFNYEINDNQSFGINYELTEVPSSNTHLFTNEQVYANQNQTDLINYYTQWSNKVTPLHQLNAYYNGTFGKLKTYFNNDYYYSNTRFLQFINETSQISSNRDVDSKSNTHSSMFASKLVLDYLIGKSTLEGGYEYIYTDRKEAYLNEQAYLPTTNDHIKEHHLAGFVSLSVPLNKVNLNAGLRFEHVASDYYEFEKLVDAQSRKYDNWFPNVGISFPIGRMSTSLSYTAKTRRPSYRELNNNIQYDDRYQYESGNPKLRPEINHDITLSNSYKWFYSSLSYQYVTNPIEPIFEPYKENSNISILTNKNYGHVNNYDATVSLSPKIGFWSPTLNTDLTGQDLVIPYMGGTLKMNNPVLFIKQLNNFSLGDYLLSLNFKYNTRGSIGIAELKPSKQFDVEVVKSFCHDRLSLQLQCTDIFRSARNSMYSYGTMMVLDKWNYSDSQAVKFTLRYNFNKAKSKYKGTGAGQDEKSRL